MKILYAEHSLFDELSERTDTMSLPSNGWEADTDMFAQFERHWVGKVSTLLHDIYNGFITRRLPLSVIYIKNLKSRLIKL